MFQDFGFETLTARQAAVILGLALGLAFGVLAERTGFCFRRGLVGEDRGRAMGVWLVALAAAMLGTQAAVRMGLISFEGHRFLSPDLPLAAVLGGGALFGAGMILTRGCVSRLTVLGGSGNLRALLVLLVVAVTAHATLKGVLSRVREAVGALTVPTGDLASLAALPGGAAFWTLAIAGAALAFALRSGNRPSHLFMGALIGLLVPLAWVGTGLVLVDEFDPIEFESLSFIRPVADGLFWTIASTAVPASFGVGLLGGVLAGALLTSLAFGSFRLQSFDSPRQTGRYMAGAALMGLGGVLAGGCTIGAGLAGLPTLSVAALLTLLAIAAGGWVTHRLVDGGPFAAAAQAAPRPAGG